MDMNRMRHRKRRLNDQIIDLIRSRQLNHRRTIREARGVVQNLLSSGIRPIDQESRTADEPLEQIVRVRGDSDCEIVCGVCRRARADGKVRDDVVGRLACTIALVVGGSACFWCTGAGAIV